MGGEFIEEDLERGCRAAGHLQFEVLSIHRGVRPEEVRVLEHLLEGANGLHATRGDTPASAGEEAKPALVLAVQVNTRAAIGRLLAQLRAESREVFFSASTARGSFFTCDLRAPLHEAP